MLDCQGDKREIGGDGKAQPMLALIIRFVSFSIWKGENYFSFIRTLGPADISLAL